MTKKKPARSKNIHYAGFTLIEIAVVLIIIGIISVFATDIYTRYREKTQLKIAQTMLNIYAQELTAYYLKSGRIPSSSEEFQIFENQLNHNPNKNSDYNVYFLIEADLNNNNLLAVPQRRHPYKSYARMQLKDLTIQTCRNANAQFKAEGGNCNNVITDSKVFQ